MNAIFKHGQIGEFTKVPSKISDSYWSKDGGVHVYRMGTKWIRAFVPEGSGIALSSKEFKTRREAMAAR